MSHLNEIKDYDGVYCWFRYNFLPWLFWDLWRYNIPYFFKNLMKWKSFLWHYRTYDSWHILDMLENMIRDQRAGKAEHFVGGEQVVDKMTKVANGLKRLKDCDITDIFDVLEKLPRHLWPCQCRKNFKTIKKETNHEDGSSTWEFILVDDSSEEGSWRPCKHNYEHQLKINTDLSDWVFTEISKHHNKWWD